MKMDFFTWFMPLKKCLAYDIRDPQNTIIPVHHIHVCCLYSTAVDTFFITEAVYFRIDSFVWVDSTLENETLIIYNSFNGQKDLILWTMNK